MRITGITGAGSPDYTTQATQVRGYQPDDTPNNMQVQDTKQDIGMQSSQADSPDTANDGGSNPVRRQSTDPKDISMTFLKEETFDYLGKESNPARLDVEKAVSDMKKDDILQEYQYFVGGQPDLEYDGDIDGRFFIKN